MRGDDDRPVVVLNYPKQHIQEFASRDGIEPAGRFIEDEQLGLEPDRQQDRQLLPLSR